MDNTTVLNVSSRASQKNQRIDRYNPNVYDAIQNIRVCKKYGLNDEYNSENNSVDFLSEYLSIPGMLSQTLSDFSISCRGNIGGWVVKNWLTKKSIIRCEMCRNALFQECPIRAEFLENSLIQAKTRDGLIFPSASVVIICKRTEELLRRALNRNKGMAIKESNFPALLCSKVMQELIEPPCTLFPTLNEHLFDDAIEELSNHMFILAKKVCKCYITLRLFAATNLASDAVIGMKKRNHMTRQII